MDLTEFFEKTIEYVKVPDLDMLKIRPRIYCKDGVHLSVQASKFHYSTPRENGSVFCNVEVGFPSVAPPADTWWSYFDGKYTDEEATNSVYGYIPIELVQEFIDDHGGIDEEKTFATTS